MTQDELQGVINAVLSALRTNAKTIESLPVADSLTDSDSFEISGGKRVTFATLNELLASVSQEDLNDVYTAISKNELQRIDAVASADDVTLLISTKGKALSVKLPIASLSKAGLISSEVMGDIRSATMASSLAVNQANSAVSTANQALQTANRASETATTAMLSAKNADSSSTAAKATSNKALAIVEGIKIYPFDAFCYRLSEVDSLPEESIAFSTYIHLFYKKVSGEWIECTEYHTQNNEGQKVIKSDCVYQLGKQFYAPQLDSLSGAFYYLTSYQIGNEEINKLSQRVDAHDSSIATIKSGVSDIGIYPFNALCYQIGELGAYPDGAIAFAYQQRLFYIKDNGEWKDYSEYNTSDNNYKRIPKTGRIYRMGDTLYVARKLDDSSDLYTLTSYLVGTSALDAINVRIDAVEPIGNTINATTQLPLPTGEYYSDIFDVEQTHNVLSAIYNANLASLGRVVTFATEPGVWKTYQYLGPNTTKAQFVDNLSNWMDYGTLNSLLAEWTQGKRKIVDALNDWSDRADTPPATSADSFDSLAARILALPVKPQDFTTAVPHTLNGSSPYDLLEVMHNNQRTDYPYMWGLILPADSTTDTVALTGADAYLTSDGVFTQGSAEHTFNDPDTTTHRFIVFYNAAPDYVIAPPYGIIPSIVAYNGRPVFQLTDTTKKLGSIDSFTPEKYEVQPSQFIINNNTLTRIHLPGLLNLPTGCMINSNICADLWLPALRQFAGYAGFQNFPLTRAIHPALEEVSANYLYNGGSAIEYHLPSFKRITGGSGVVYNRLNTDISISAPNVESMINGYFLRSLKMAGGLTFSKFREMAGGYFLDSVNGLEWLDVSGLPTMSGGMLVNNCANLTSIDASGLQTMSGGTLANNCANLTSIDASGLQTMSGGNFVNSCTSLRQLTLLELTEFNGAYYIVWECSALTSVHYPKLKYLKLNNTALHGNCNVLETVELPALETLEGSQTNGAILGGCPKMKTISLPNLRFANMSSGAYIFQGVCYADGPITINMPGLLSTNNKVFNLGNPSNVLHPDGIHVNLGAPDGGYIALNMSNATTAAYVKSVTVQPGFRSYLNISAFTALPADCLTAIIDNLADNTEHPTLQIVLGATNLAKLTDEVKLRATQKNYSLS